MNSSITMATPGMGPGAADQAREVLARQGMERAAEAGSGEVGQQFEALMLRKVVAAMRATVPEGGMFKSGSGSQMLDHMIETALSDTLSSGGGIGLSKMIESSVSGEGQQPLAMPGAGAAPVDALPTSLMLEARAPVSQRTTDAVATPAPWQEWSDVSANSPYTWEQGTGLDDGVTPLSEQLPPSSDPWLQEPGAEDRLTAILRGGSDED